jgi:YD repeat-containing protein
MSSVETGPSHLCWVGEQALSRKERNDAVGNLTNIAYPVSHAITLQYDALNRLTNMVDGVGSTTYGYDEADQVLSVTGQIDIVRMAEVAS